MKVATNLFFVAFALLSYTPHALAAIASSTPVETVTLNIRDGSTVVGPFTVDLPALGSPDVGLTPTAGGTSHNVPARSVLGLLAALDATTTDFNITDLAYFPSFSSFIVNCVSVPAANSSPDCYNWTYAVDGSFPFVGMDAYSLADGDVVYVLFGSQWQVTAPPTALTDTPFVATVAEYDPASGLYVPAGGQLVGAVQFDSSFNAIEFATSTTDTSGSATLSLSNAGSYSVGLASTYYFPNTPITVSTSTPVATTTAPAPVSSGGGGGGSTSHRQLDVKAALAYLATQQQGDGSFGPLFLSDWAALAVAASDAGNIRAKLASYLSHVTPTLSSITDYERHVMALEALGINPYSGTSVDYISPIVRSFDGAQIGDAHLDNDDIFALFPLLHAGYTSDDLIIQKTVAFIISAQNQSGAWDASVDMTAAAVQALEQVPNLSGVPSALNKARAYLHAQQGTDGGFNNSFSTSWVLQAITAFGDSLTSWTPQSQNPQDYLSTLEQNDGGVEPLSAPTQTRIWATSYAVPAALGKTWDSLLQSFPKPLATLESAPIGLVLGIATSTVAAVSTSTPTIATSTLISASTTPPLLTKLTPTKKFSPSLAKATSTTPLTSTTPQTRVRGFGAWMKGVFTSITSFFLHLL